MANEDELPYLPDGGFYKNINVIRFEVPLADKLQLAELVQKAGKMLIGNESAILLTRDEKAKATVAESIKLQKI